jgi:hypothetical protein
MRIQIVLITAALSCAAGLSSATVAAEPAAAPAASAPVVTAQDSAPAAAEPTAEPAATEPAAAPPAPAAPAAPAPPVAPRASGPSREQIARQIAEAESSRGAGIAGIVVGALALVAGVASLVGEATDEDERDQRGYSNCYSNYSCPEDEKEEPSLTGFAVGFVAGAGLIAIGTVAAVKGSRRANNLRRKQRQLELGYDPDAGVATVAWSF